MQPVRLRIAVITPGPQGCAANATTNLLSAKKRKLRYVRNVGFPARRFCTLLGRRSGVTKAERRKTGRNPNKIFLLTLNSPLHPNKINFRNASGRRKFGIIPPVTKQIRKSAIHQPANSQSNNSAIQRFRKSANQQIRKSATPQIRLLCS